MRLCANEDLQQLNVEARPSKLDTLAHLPKLSSPFPLWQPNLPGHVPQISFTGTRTPMILLSFVEIALRCMPLQGYLDLRVGIPRTRQVLGVF